MLRGAMPVSCGYAVFFFTGFLMLPAVPLGWMSIHMASCLTTPFCAGAVCKMWPMVFGAGATCNKCCQAGCGYHTPLFVLNSEVGVWFGVAWQSPTGDEQATRETARTALCSVLHMRIMSSTFISRFAHLWAISDFFPVQCIGDPQQGRGDLATLPTCGPFQI